MKLSIDESQIKAFWAKFPGHISFLEESIRLGHNEEFKIRYDAINISARNLHPDLMVEFHFDMMDAKLQAVIVTTKNKDTRTKALLVAKLCPEELKPFVSGYRLPALDWGAEVTTSWMKDLARQFGMKSLADEIGSCLADLTFALNMNHLNNRVLLQVGFKNNREKKAIGTELVQIMLEMLLGEQVVLEAIDSLSFKLAKELGSASKGWLHVSGLKVRDSVLQALF